MDWEFIQIQQTQLRRALPLPDLLPPSWALEPDTDCISLSQSSSSCSSSSSASGNFIADCPYLRSSRLQRYKIICKDKKFDKKTLHDDFPMLRIFDRIRNSHGLWNDIHHQDNDDSINDEEKEVKVSHVNGIHVQIDLIDMSYVKGSSYPLSLIVSQVELGEISHIGHLNLTHALSRDISRPGFIDLMISVFSLPCLKSLDISYNRLRSEVLVYILRRGLNPGTCQLESLDLSGNCCNGACGRILGKFLTSPNCHLKTLKMNECGMNAGKSNDTAISGMRDEIMTKISSSTADDSNLSNNQDYYHHQYHDHKVYFTSLENLELGDNPREDENLDMYSFLFTAFTKLSTLKLAQLIIKDESVATLVMNSLISCHNLCSLCLSSCKLNDSTLNALLNGYLGDDHLALSTSSYRSSSNMSILPSLTSLDVSSNFITNFSILSISDTLSGLRSLNISGNRPSRDSFIVFCNKQIHAQALTTVEVSVDGLLAKATSLRVLNLSCCLIDEAMTKVLFNMLFKEWALSVPSGELRDSTSVNTCLHSNACPPITTLILNDNPIGYRGGELISNVIRNRPWHPLRTLSLVNCSLGVIGTTAMIECLKVDKRLFDIALHKNYALQDADIRIQSAYTDAINDVSIRLSYIPLQMKLLFVWVMNTELVRIKRKDIHSCVEVDYTKAVGFSYHGMPSEVLRYILDFLSVIQMRRITLENTSSRRNNDSMITPAQDPLFSATTGHWSLRDSSWV